MHDAKRKRKTVEILPQIIDYYKNEGYDFKVIKTLLRKKIIAIKVKIIKINQVNSIRKHH